MGGRGVDGRLVMLTFANKGTGRDNRKADPEAIDDTTEQGDDLVAEEGRKGNDDQDGDGYQPTCGQVSHLF